MKSTSRLSWTGKSVVFHATPFLILVAFFAVITAFFYIPAGQSAPTLNFFGFYAGQYFIYGLSIEHEWVGVSLLIALPIVAAMVGTNRAWFLSLMTIGAFLFVSDFADVFPNYNPLNWMSGNLITNTAGVEASVITGVVIAVLAGSVITGGKWR